MTGLSRLPSLYRQRGTSTPLHSMRCALWNTEARARAGFRVRNNDTVSVAQLCRIKSEGGVV